MAPITTNSNIKKFCTNKKGRKNSPFFIDVEKIFYFTENKSSIIALFNAFKNIL